MIDRVNSGIMGLIGSIEHVKVGALRALRGREGGQIPTFKELLDRYSINAAGSSPDELAPFINHSLDSTEAIVKRIGYAPPS